MFTLNKSDGISPKYIHISNSESANILRSTHTPRSETMIQTTSFSSSSSSLRCCNCCFHHHRWTEKKKARGGRNTPLGVRSRAKEEDDDDGETTPSREEETRTAAPVVVSLAKLNTSPRRIALAMTSTTALAFGANFLGITSLALRANEPLARKLKLDAVYEVSGYRRDRNEEKGYGFLFPNEYLADQTIARRNAMKKAQSLDLPSLRETKGQKNVGEPGKRVRTDGDERGGEYERYRANVHERIRFRAVWRRGGAGELVVRERVGETGIREGGEVVLRERDDRGEWNQILSVRVYDQDGELVSEKTSPFLRRIRILETCIRLWRSVQWRDGMEWEKSFVNRQTRFAFLRRNRRAFDDDE